MIGLGIGLTPSADDYLLGLSVILFIKGHPANQYREAFITALQSARQNTTPLSAITLEAAINQRYRESIAVLINLMVNQSTTFSIEAIADIKNIGSSSGSDMLLGMADACALSQTYGGIMSVKIVVKKNTYFDSVSLMSISTRANKLDGVEQAFVAMATEMNKGVLNNLGLLTPELEAAKTAT